MNLEIRLFYFLCGSVFPWAAHPKEADKTPPGATFLLFSQKPPLCPSS